MLHEAGPTPCGICCDNALDVSRALFGGLLFFPAPWYSARMTRGILIAGTESSLSAAIAAEAGKRVERFAAAFIPGSVTLPERGCAQPAGEKLIPLSWNPGSPLSARTLVLQGINRLERVDEAILVCTPPSVRKQADELNSVEIETMVSDHIKGWFFLVKELCVFFASRKAGTLALVLKDIGSAGGKDETVDLMGPSVAASFRAFAQGLLAASGEKPYGTLAFSSEAADDPAFASFIFKIIDDGGKRALGKWHTYSKGLFTR
jgi:hypothetical protein